MATKRCGYCGQLFGAFGVRDRFCSEHCAEGAEYELQLLEYYEAKDELEAEVDVHALGFKS